jgi:predicted small secreted protein
MKRLLIAALCAAPMMLASCATMPTPTVGQAVQIGSAIDRAQSAYDRIASTAVFALPFLSPERAARVRLAMALAERGLLAARNAANAAEQLAALKQAEAATATISAVAGS